METVQSFLRGLCSLSLRYNSTELDSGTVRKSIQLLEDWKEFWNNTMGLLFPFIMSRIFIMPIMVDSSKKVSQVFMGVSVRI